ERLQMLRTSQNTLACPIFSLPPEVLSRVFFLCADDNDALCNLRWTKLMLVCRHWNAVALNTPELWSFIDLNP
ncbi:hypothetical protein PENSPDRAFT_555458, partial [Peniophora sp. CONT]